MRPRFGAHLVHALAEHVAVGPREVHVLEDAVRERRGRKRLERPQPVGADDQHLARLDVAHVGGADQIERAGLRADDAGVAEPAERERPEPVRIAHGDQPVLASACTSENAPCTCDDRLDDARPRRVAAFERAYRCSMTSVSLLDLEDRPLAHELVAQLAAR